MEIAFLVMPLVEHVTKKILSSVHPVTPLQLIIPTSQELLVLKFVLMVPMLTLLLPNVNLVNLPVSLVQVQPPIVSLVTPV